MMLICPKCGDYYASGSLAFCLADGTPLVKVNPGTDEWREGAKVIEQKEHALRKRKRRQRWWRVSSVMTMLVMTVVVYGVVAKRYVYLIPAASPSPTPTVVIKEAPTPTVAIVETPTPTIVIKETPTPTMVIKETPTPTIEIKETPTPKVVVKETPTPTIVIKETPTPKVVIKETPPPKVVKETPALTPKVCSEADEKRDDQIIRGFAATWRGKIQGERAKIIAENVPDGAKNTEAVLGEIESQVTFLLPCKSAVVTARYSWQVSYSLNGAQKAKTVQRKATMGCAKVFGMWVCR